MFVVIRGGEVGEGKELQWCGDVRKLSQVREDLLPQSSSLSEMDFVGSSRASAAMVNALRRVNGWRWWDCWSRHVGGHENEASPVAKCVTSSSGFDLVIGWQWLTHLSVRLAHCGASPIFRGRYHGGCNPPFFNLKVPGSTWFIGIGRCSIISIIPLTRLSSSFTGTLVTDDGFALFRARKTLSKLRGIWLSARPPRLDNGLIESIQPSNVQSAREPALPSRLTTTTTANLGGSIELIRTDVFMRPNGSKRA